MIPKIIHYCWFGGKPKPKLAAKCLASWRKHCQDYNIIEWNEALIYSMRMPRSRAVHLYSIIIRDPTAS